MAGLFEDASAGTLRRLAEAFRSGQLGPSLSAFSINKITACSSTVVADLLRLSAEGMSPAHLALLLDACAEAADAQTGRLTAELVWTGPEAVVSQSRDTSVVVQELFSAAEQDVLVSTFVVRHIADVFRPLAVRMDHMQGLRARIFLHIGREWRDTSEESQLLREFADEFRAAWPGQRRPEVYYDPRGLSSDSATRATWHAKCVIVDGELTLVTSANFTEWAQQRNVEAGVLVRNRHFASQLGQQFESLVQSRQVRRLPGF